MTGLPEATIISLWPLDIEDAESNGDLLLDYQDPLTPPTLSSAELTGGQFTLEVTNILAGPDYAVQGSTNLVDWSTLFVTNTLTTSFLWTDPAAGTQPMQFYRVLVGPPLP